MNFSRPVLPLINAILAVLVSLGIAMISFDPRRPQPVVAATVSAQRRIDRLEHEIAHFPNQIESVVELSALYGRHGEAIWGHALVNETERYLFMEGTKAERVAAARPLARAYFSLGHNAAGNALIKRTITKCRRDTSLRNEPACGAGGISRLRILLSLGEAFVAGAIDVTRDPVSARKVFRAALKAGGIGSRTQKKRDETPDVADTGSARQE